jgi:putative ABC transport system permease protein
VIAMLLASAPFIQRSLDTFAMLRCFGAQQRFIQRVMLWQTLSIAIIGGVLGCAVGYMLQQGLGLLAGSLFVETLAPATIQPFILGLGVSLCVMLALMWPHLLAIKQLATVRILRREVEINLKQDWLNYLPVSLVVLVLILLQAHTLTMALLMVAGLLITCALIAALAYALVHVLFKLSIIQHSPNVVAIQVGLSNLKRRIRLSMAQMIAFGLGLTVIILLSIVKSDLMDSWQASLPIDAPNRFVINLQADQLNSFTTFFSQQALSKPIVYPMVKGRLVAINQREVSADDYSDERAKRLISREFNLSWAAKMQTDNRLLEGAWWTADDKGRPYISLEQDLANALKIKLNDTLSYDIAGTKIVLKVTSIRKVEWDSMRANFFAVTPPQVLSPFNASYMTAFYLPPKHQSFIHQLVKAFPNLTVIDVAALMEQVRGIMQKMSVAVAYVFMFSLVSGLAVLFAALIATQEERTRESALLRALGATRQQVSWAMLAEFFSVALVAVSVAIVLANVLAWTVSHYVLEISYQFSPVIAITALICALVLIPFAAWTILRQHLNTPPKHILNNI